MRRLLTKIVLVRVALPSRARVSYPSGPLVTIAISSRAVWSTTMAGAPRDVICRLMGVKDIEPLIPAMGLSLTFPLASAGLDGRDYLDSLLPLTSTLVMGSCSRVHEEERRTLLGDSAKPTPACEARTFFRISLSYTLPLSMCPLPSIPPGHKPDRAVSVPPFRLRAGATPATTGCPLYRRTGPCEWGTISELEPALQSLQMGLRDKETVVNVVDFSLSACLGTLLASFSTLCVIFPRATAPVLIRFLIPLFRVAQDLCLLQLRAPGPTSVKHCVLQSDFTRASLAVKP
ncbi:hypothetical protein MSAN_01231400 [Mycena sanguinolenta]|uniref:Uncharacterized protein n=1 Tax=Mycena sanguinolenta TaxID=230812 RepID=A0A8H6YJ75_9AGAR|nr:hypothetical protein MSAN_01231400 [Mycena sanguinolenta]